MQKNSNLFEVKFIPEPLISIFLIILIFLPRVLDTGRFLTTDEYGLWLGYTSGFREALANNDFAATAVSSHYPGVTTNWLGTIGWGLLDSLTRAYGSFSLVDSLRVIRLPIAIVSACCIIIGYFLLRRLFDPNTALLSTMFWAADPFLVAHSRILGVDSLLAGFITISWLAALCAFTPKARIRWSFLLGSAFFFALATLTKLPGILLGPSIALLFIVRFLHSETPKTTIVTYGIVWALVVIISWLIIYPATWSRPLETLLALQVGLELGQQPHEIGNFFLGNAIAAPGAAYYPIAISLRLTPWVLLGLIFILPLAFLTKSTTTSHWVVRCLLIMVGIFLLGISIAPKKFDRYALPVFPALDILGACGTIWLIRKLKTNSTSIFLKQPMLAQLGKHEVFFTANPPLVKVGSITVIILLGFNLAWYHPHQLAYYNPMLGGGAVATKMILVGWGEGLEKAGDYISSRSDSCEKAISAWAMFLLEPFVCNEVINPGQARNADNVSYVVFYISQLQRDYDRAEFEQLLSTSPPEYIVKIHGIEYVYIFKRNT